MGKLAEAQSCARRYADVDCEEIPRDARGDCVGKQSGEGRGAERGRQADYSGGATRERNEEPAGAIPRAQGGYASRHRGSLQCQLGRFAQVEPFESGAGKPRNGAADLYDWGRAGSEPSQGTDEAQIQYGHEGQAEPGGSRGEKSINALK